MNVHFLLKMEFTCFPWRCNPQRTQYSCHNITIIFHRDSTASILTCSHLINHFSNLVFLSPTLFCSWILSTDSQQSYHLLSGLQQTQRLMVFFLLKGVGVYSSEGAGRLLFKESIWLDSLTNCIKRQSCPWSAPQLIDGSTHLHRKSSRQNGDKSVAGFCSPPSCTTYLPPISFLLLPLLTQNVTRLKFIQNKVKFLPAFMCWHKLCKVCWQHANMLIRHFICKFAVSELNDSEFTLWGSYKIKKPFYV